MGTSRRSFIASAAGLAACSLLRIPAAHAQRLPQRLRIPELLDARARGQALALDIRAGTTEFFPGVASATLGYNGAYLGPTLRVHDGDDVQVAVANHLAQPTTVHWHGLLVPGPLDGGPHQEIAPGGAWRPVLPVRQRAATLFYHSHQHHATARQVYFGLAGMLIVRDAAEERLGLPSEYGVDDLPVLLQDRQFSRGRLVMPGGMMAAMAGARGDTILVNGTPDAYVRVPARRVRLRLANASNARDYHLAFDDGRAFHWIAADGGLLESPVELRAISLSPGERAEIVVDFASGPATLVTGPDDNLPMMGMMGGTAAANGAAQPVLAFEVERAAAASPPLPARLADVPSWDASRATRLRRFRLEMGMGMMGGRGMGGMGMGRGMGAMGGFTINGRGFDPARVDERARLGDLEIWEVAADTMAHPFHVHGVQFQVVARGRGAPATLDAGLKDTVRVDAPVRLLVRFTQPSLDAPFMYHCHILEHEDHGMMGQLAVA